MITMIRHRRWRRQLWRRWYRRFWCRSGSGGKVTPKGRTQRAPKLYSGGPCNGFGTRRSTQPRVAKSRGQKAAGGGGQNPHYGFLTRKTNDLKAGGGGSESGEQFLATDFGSKNHSSTGSAIREGEGGGDIIREAKLGLGPTGGRIRGGGGETKSGGQKLSYGFGTRKTSHPRVGKIWGAKSQLGSWNLENQWPSLIT